MFKVNYGNTKTVGEMYAKLTVKTRARRQLCLSGVFIVNFEQIAHIVLLLVGSMINS